VEEHQEILVLDQQENYYKMEVIGMLLHFKKAVEDAELPCVLLVLVCFIQIICQN